MPLTSNRALTKHGVLMIVLGTFVCALGTFMAKPAWEDLGYVLAAALTTACLVTSVRSIGIIRARALPNSLLRVYLAGGASSIACCMIFWLVQPSRLDVHVVGILVAVLGLFWASCYMRLAFYFRANVIQSGLLSILAAFTCSVGIILASRAGLSKLGVVTASGCYMIVLGAQVYLTAAFLHLQVARSNSTTQG